MRRRKSGKVAPISGGAQSMRRVICERFAAKDPSVAELYTKASNADRANEGRLAAVSRYAVLSMTFGVTPDPGRRTDGPAGHEPHVADAVLAAHPRRHSQLASRA